MRRAVAVILAVVALAACGGGERELVGLERDPAPQVDAVALPDVSRDGAPFEFRAEPGGLLAVYFGYTNCPDVCPTTMAALAQAREGLGDDADRVGVAMVTVDPERDTNVLTGYVQSFVDGAHAIATDDVSTLREVAESFGAGFVVEKGASGEVSVGHSEYLFAVDDTGRLVVTWPAPTPADDLEGDLRQLLERV